MGEVNASGLLQCFDTADLVTGGASSLLENLCHYRHMFFSRTTGVDSQVEPAMYVCRYKNLCFAQQRTA